MRPIRSRPSSILQPTLRGSQYDAEAQSAASGEWRDEERSRAEARPLRSRAGCSGCCPAPILTQNAEITILLSDNGEEQGTRGEVNLRESQGGCRSCSWRLEGGLDDYSDHQT